MQDDNSPALRLAGLSLRVPGPPSGTMADEDWLDACARVEAPGAVVEARGNFLRVAGLADLHHDLVAMHRDLRGSAALQCIEAVLRIDMTCGRRGDIAMTVDITPDTATQAHRFDFVLDQTALGPAVAALRRMLGPLARR